METTFKFILFLLFASTPKILQADNIISFFMRPFPHWPNEVKFTEKDAIKKSTKLQKPEKIANYTLRSILESNTACGIFCTYKGQLSVSNSDGQVNFTRRQERNDMKLLITERINPVLQQQQTVHHWEIEIGTPSELFSLIPIDDPNTNETFWDVKKIDPIENNIIPLNTVIIFAKPSHIFVPEGITITEKSPQLLMPDIYVKKNIDKLTTSLYILDLKRFFWNPQKIYQSTENQLLKQLY